MLLSIRTPRMNMAGPQYMDQALAAIHQANPHRHPLTFLLGRDAESVSLFCRAGDELQSIIQDQLFAQYPDCTIEQVSEATLSYPPAWHSWNCDLHLALDLFPIKRYPQFEDSLNRVTADPLSALLTALAREKADQVRSIIEITLRPARDRIRKRAQRCLRRLATPFFHRHPRLAHSYVHLALSYRRSLRVLGWLLGRFARSEGPGHTDALHQSGTRLHDREEHLQAASDKVGRFLFEAQIRIVVAGPADAAEQATRKLRKIAGAFGVYHSPGLGSFHSSRIRCNGTRPTHPHTPASLLSTEEVATIFHPPTLTVRAPTLAAVESREFEPPTNLPTPDAHEDLAVLGHAVFRGRRQRFGLLPDDRRRHVVIEGKTGMGKTTLLHHLITSDIEAGQGLALIDPHGDLAEAVLQHIPKHRTNDVVLFDVGDVRYPLAFNPLACPQPDQRPLVASGILSTFKKLYADSWGPRLEHILRNALLTVLEVPGSSLLTVLRILSDAGYRRSVLAKVKDPVVRTFWENEFAAMPPKFQAEAIAPIQNKVGHFVSSPLLRNILGQPRTGLDLRAIMDSGKVLLVNLSKGRIGDDASALLGSFLVTSLQLAAMSRANIPEAERKDYFVYIDEFQNFATDSFATILSESRKYRMALTCANQYLSQISEETQAAVFGNVGTLVSFQVGAQDTEILATQLGGGMTEQDLLTLPRYQAYVRLLVDGMPSRPFSMRTLPPSAKPHDPRRVDLIRRLSREAHCRPAATVEAELLEAFAG